METEKEIKRGFMRKKKYEEILVILFEKFK